LSSRGRRALVAAALLAALALPAPAAAFESRDLMCTVIRQADGGSFRVRTLGRGGGDPLSA
jgi:hypothetical protein